MKKLLHVVDCLVNVGNQLVIIYTSPMDPSRARNYERHPRNTALVGREAQVFFRFGF